MTRNALPWLFAALFTTASPWAQAQKVSPGLWEHGVSMKSQSGRIEAARKQMDDMMASMSPQQRKMMQDMMAQQGLGLGANGNSLRVCLTKEDADRDEPPPPEEGCTQTAKRNGNIWQVSFKCSGPPPSSGEGTVTLHNKTAWTGQFNVLTELEGKPERVQMTTASKWISADCGAVKPVPR
jgi:hypothetical protein